MDYDLRSSAPSCSVQIELTQSGDYTNAVGEPTALTGDSWAGVRNLTLQLTGAEFTRLFSAVTAGAKIVYPGEDHAVTWLLWGAVEYPLAATFGAAVFG